ncbi:hypothetical protein MJD09_18750 [bacterium]|nr:hypothetical protein [bacterium]
MNTCKFFQENVFLLDELGEDEQLDLRQHVSECKICQELFEQRRLILDSLAEAHKDSHPDSTLLTRYSLYSADPNEPDYDGQRLKQVDIENVESHLSHCQLCQTKVQDIEREFHEIESHLEKEGLPSLTLGGESPQSIAMLKVQERLTALWRWIKEVASVPLPRFAPIAVGAMAVLVMAIFVGPLAIRSDNPYLSLTSLEGERFTSLTRSGETTSLSSALQAFHQGEYPRAITQFELFLTQLPDSLEAAYAHYLAGVSYLVEAKETILGTVTGFDTEKVNNGIKHLRDVLSRSSNLGLREDSQWYMAKAYLMLEQGSEAIKTLEQVVALRGRRFREARNLISEIESASRRQ